MAGYVPTLITRRLLAHPTSPIEPTSEHFEAALLFADISGFTALTEQLAQQGPAGAEILTRELNNYFGQLIDLITAYGGDVVKFAGDSLTAIWPLPPLTPPPSERGDNLSFDGSELSLVTCQATACGLAIQTASQNYRTAAGKKLSLRISLGSGPVNSVHVGGIYNRWEFVLIGDLLKQASRADELAQPGEIVLSPQVWALTKSYCSGQLLTGGYVRLESIKSEPPVTALQQPDLLPEIEQGLKSYIPAAIVNRVSAGQGSWLAELRRVSILFINLPDLTLTTPLDTIQRAVQTLQTALYHYEGSVNKIGMDDKGTTLVAALGLPPLAHEDDAARAVEAALEMQLALSETLQWRCAIGITTGRAFCGSVGNKTRREYTMMGDMVNLGARLMQAALARGYSILCDQPTYQATQTSAQLEHLLGVDLDDSGAVGDVPHFETLEPIKVKGKAKLIPIYRPSGQERMTISVPDFQAELVGRNAEQTLLTKQLQILRRGDSGGVVIIEGEAGIGKSQLVANLLEQTQMAGITALIGAGETIAKSTPYYAWRPVFKQLFKVEGQTNKNTITRRSHVLSLLPTDPQLLKLIPLLNAVLSLGLSDNGLTAQMGGEARAHNTHKLLIHLLQTAADLNPTMIIIEDAHWLDSASWALLRQVCQNVQPLLLIIVIRPLPKPWPVEYDDILKVDSTQHLKLGLLSQEDTLTLVQHRLNVNSLPQAVADLIINKAEGHPFFSEELAYALRDKGLIKISNGHCHITAEVSRLDSINFPQTIQGIITSRIDRLVPEQQLALKVASTIGRSFTVQILHDIYPVKADKPDLLQHLDSLTQLDLLTLDTPEPETAYMFKHALTKDVSYNLMAFAQRQHLHQAVAEWYEQTYIDELVPFYPLLAHHWQMSIGQHQVKSQFVLKSINYLEMAGEQALRDGVYQEAVDFFNKIINLVRAHNNGAFTSQSSSSQASDSATAANPLGYQQLARWQRLLGEAYYGLGQPHKSRNHLEQALTLLQHPMPTTTKTLINKLVGAALHQARYWPQMLKASKNPAQHDDLPAEWARQTTDNYKKPSPEYTDELEAARAYERLALIHYIANEFPAGLHAVLRGFKLAESAGPSPELVRFYADISVVLRLIRIHRLAEAYRQHALKTARTLNNMPALAWVLMVTGGSSIGFTSWAEIDHSFEQALKLYQHLGDTRQQGDTLTLVGWAHYFQGQFEAGKAAFDEVYNLGYESDNLEHQAWGITGQAMNFLGLGQTQKALTLLETNLTLLTVKTEVRIAEIPRYGLAAVSRLRLGQIQSARQAARAVTRLVDKTLPVSFALFDGYTGAAEVHLSLWEAALLARDQTQAESLKQAARKACQALRRFALIHPMGQPRSWLWHGLYHWLVGKKRKANKAWQKSLTHAQRLHMPFEAGLAHYEIGRHLSPGDPARQEHLTHALEIFKQLQTTHHLTQTEQELSVSK